MNLEELEQECRDIQSFLEEPCSEDVSVVIDRGTHLNVYMARTGKMLADAKFLLNYKKQDESMLLIERLLDSGKISAKVQNALVDSMCKEEQYIVDWANRLNAACTHQLDWCRSLLSKAKEEMRQNNNTPREMR